MTSQFYRNMTFTASEDISPKALDQVQKAARGKIICYREIGDGMMTVKVRSEAKTEPSEKVQANILATVRAIVPGAEWESDTTG